MAITLTTAPANYYPYLDNVIYNNGKGKLCVGNTLVTDYSDWTKNENCLYGVGFNGYVFGVTLGDKDVIFGKFTGKYRLLSQGDATNINLKWIYGGNNDYRIYEVILFNPHLNVTNEGITATYQKEFIDYNNHFKPNSLGVSNYNSYLKAVEDNGNYAGVVWRDFFGYNSKTSYFPHTGKEYNDFNFAQTGKRIVDWDTYFKDFNQKFITTFKTLFQINRDVVWHGYEYVPIDYTPILLWTDEYPAGAARIYGNSIKNVGVEFPSVDIVTSGICYSTTNATPNVDDDSVTTVTGIQSTYEVTGLTLNTSYYMCAYAILENDDVIYSATRTVQTKAAKVVPTFTFSVAGTITNNSAKISAKVAENDYTVTEAGIVYATHTNPTTSDNKIALETLPSGNINITGLAAGTKYYVRQYAIYGSSTVYSALTTDVTLAFVGDHFYGVGTGEGLYPYAKLTDYFTTAGQPVLGKVIASLPTEIQLSQTTVELDSHITSEGGGTVLESGMWISTTPNPSITGTKKVFTGSYVNGDLGKQFTTSYTGLIAGTLYYYAPYIRNIAGTYTSNDTILRFRTYETTGIKIDKATKLSSTSLNVEYNFTSIGKGEVDAIGLCYKQTGVPTVADAKTVDGTELGAYKTVIGMLQNNVSYNIRPYVTKTVNGGSTVTEYGDMITASMTDVTIPTPINPKPTVITLSTEGLKYETSNALISANVTLLGTSAVTRKGFVVAKVDNLLDVTPITFIADPTNSNVGVDQFVEEVALNGKGNELGLMSKYINPAHGWYHYAAFVINASGTSYGAVQFLGIPEITAYDTEVISSPAAANKNSAILWGVSSYMNDVVIEEMGFEYWKKSTPATVLEVSVPVSRSAYSANVTGLLASTEYEFKAFIKETGESRVYGSVLEFTTLASEIVEPTVILQTAIKNDTGFECFVESLTNEELLLGKGVVWIRNEDGIFDVIPTIKDNRTPVGSNGEDLQINVGVGWYMIAAYIETAAGMKVSLNGLKVVQWTDDTPDTDEDGNPTTDITIKFKPPTNPPPAFGQVYYFKDKKYLFNGEGWVKQVGGTVDNSPISQVVNQNIVSAQQVPAKASTIIGKEAIEVVEYAKRDEDGRVFKDTYFDSESLFPTVTVNIAFWQNDDPTEGMSDGDYLYVPAFKQFSQYITGDGWVLAPAFEATFGYPIKRILYHHNGRYYIWDGVDMRYQANVSVFNKVETIESKIYSLQSFADNTAALAGGLVAGDFYHTSGVVKVVI